MLKQLQFFGPSATLHHVGMAVRSIESAIPGLESVEDPIQNVRVAFADLAGLTIELIEPATENSPIDESLKKGIKLLHICIEVPSLEAALDCCRKHGFLRTLPRRGSSRRWRLRSVLICRSGGPAHWLSSARST